MTTRFELVTEEFIDDMNSIRALVSAISNMQGVAPKARIVAGDSATLLVSAKFEEYAREMARLYAREVVAVAGSVRNLNPDFINTAWERTVDEISKIRIDGIHQPTAKGIPLVDAKQKFDEIFEFCCGDISKDIYATLVHTDRNIRPKVLNSLFKMSGLSNICNAISGGRLLLKYFGNDDPASVYGLFVAWLEDFIERRNTIAHSLASRQSSSPEQVEKDISALLAVANSLCETLSAKVIELQQQTA